MDREFILVGQDVFIGDTDTLIHKTEKSSWLTSSSLKSSFIIVTLQRPTVAKHN